MSKKFDYVDAIRGLAILMVIMAHTSQYGQRIDSRLINQILDHASRGVQLFFVASAFTLFLSSHNRTHESHQTLNFFIRRFFRIAPMYYLGILFFSVVNSNVTKASIIANIFFIHGWHPDWVTRLVPGGWSISVEMFFYCLVPFLVKKINSLNKTIYWFIAAVLFNYLFQQVLSPYGMGDFLFFSFPNHMPVFICGIAAYMLIIKKDFLVGSKPLLFVSLLILAYMIWNDLINYVTLSGIAFMLLLIAVSKRRFRVLVNPFFTYLGKVSYSSYLVHFAVLLALNKFHFVDFIDVANTYTGVINYILRLIVVVGITIGISTLFYRFVEVPMQQVGRNLIKLCSPTLLPSQPKRLS